MGFSQRETSNEIVFNCSQSLVSRTCNYIPNSSFSFTGSTNLAAFSSGLVANWADSHGTADINNAAGTTTVSSPISGINFASMVATGDYSSIDPANEGICAKIKPLTSGGSYAFSFFRRLTKINSAPFVSVNAKFRVILIKCTNFSTAGVEYTTPTIPTNSQVIYCEDFGTSVSPWKQGLVKFTANDDYDMIWVFPIVEDPSSTNAQYYYFHFANPELVDIADFAATTTQHNGSCNLTLNANSTCSITNAQYTWYNSSNIAVGTGQNFSVSYTANTGAYTVQMTVPNAATSNCGTQVYPTASTNAFVDACKCASASSSLDITTATAEYYNTTTGHGSLYTQTLSTCTANDFCYNLDEILWLTLSSDQTTGNHWEFFFDNPAQYNSGFHYYTGTAYDQSIYGFLVITPNETGILEIRLTNSVTGTSKSIFIRIQNKASAGWWCNSLDPAYEFRVIGSGSDNPYNTYSWTFPAGMTVSNLNIRLPNFSYTTTYSGSYPANAVLNVTNAYCPSYTSTVPIQPGDPLCYARMANPVTTVKPLSLSEELERKTNVKISPNPTSSSFEVFAAKKMSSVTVNSIEGKLIKRFDSPGFKNTFNISELSKGSYLVTICYADFSKETKIIIKQ